MEGEIKTVTYEDLRSMYFEKEREVRRLLAKIEILEDTISDLEYKVYTQ